MSYPLDTRTRTQAITLAINHLVRTGGFEAATTRAIARHVGISVGTLANHLTNRERMLRVCGRTFAVERLEEIGTAVTLRGLAGLLPQGARELDRERAWLAWKELGRHTPTIAGGHARDATAERYQVQRATGVTDPDGLDLLYTFTLGLREQFCVEGEPFAAVALARLEAMAGLVQASTLS